MDSDSRDGITTSDGTSLLAAQNTVGQRRAKKTAAPQVVQRRPASKRKKFKKSLGPDFLEPAELGMQYLRDTYEPKCDICSLTMTVASSTQVFVSEELLHCNNCDAKAHPSCVNHFGCDEVAHKTQWQCHNCKICSVCHHNEPNEYLIICFSCSKGYHPKCHTNPIINRPKGHWYCENCCSKGSHQSNGNNEKKTIESSEESSHSEDNETVESLKERSFRLVVESEDNSESNDIKDNKDNCDELSEQNSKADNENSQHSYKDMDCTQVSNGVIDPVIEENSNGVDLKKNSHESQTGVDTTQTNPSVSPQKWTVEEVETFIRDAGFPSESLIFRDQEIDGRSLLLLRRMDVLTGLSLKLGPALKIYNHISRLQGRESTDNPNKS